MINDSINRFLGVLCYPLMSLDFVHNMGEVSKEKLQNDFKRQVLRFVRSNYQVNSYDEISLYLNKFYLDEIKIDYNPHNPLDMIDNICIDKIKRMAKAFISERDGKVVYKYWQNDDDEKLLGGFSGTNKLFLFQNLNRWLPLDTLVAMHMAQNHNNEAYHMHNYFGQINVSDMILDQILESGIAENHMHSGVAISYFESWENLMTLDLNATVKAIRSINVLSYETSINQWSFYILGAKCLRTLIALRLSKKENSVTTFNKLLNPESFVYRFVSAMHSSKSYKEALRFLDIEDNLDDIECIYKKIMEEIIDKSNTGETDLKEMIYELYNVPSSVKTYSENILLLNLMSYYLEPDNTKINYDDLGIQMSSGVFISLSLKYLRIKNSFFNMLVQQTSIKGLDFFKDHYNMHSRFHLKTQRLDMFWENTMRAQFQNPHIQKIEFRMSISSNESDFKKQLNAFLRAYYEILKSDYCRKVEVQGKYNEFTYEPAKKFPRVGIVYHLIKQNDTDIDDKCHFSRTKKENEFHYFSKIKSGYQNQVQYVKDIRNSDPELSRYIVGLDAASIENDTPIWVFKDAYEHARDTSTDHLNHFKDGMLDVYQSLGFTMHAGEDFRHLLSGLRRIDEVVRFLKFKAGDRIGHGTALGVNPENWRCLNPVVVIPKIELLENYLWAYYILSQHYSAFNPSILTYLENNIYKYTKEIYKTNDAIPIETLIAHYLQQFKLDSNISGCDRNCDDSLEKCVLMKSYNDELKFEGSFNSLEQARNCSKYVKRMLEPINIEVTKQDTEIAKTVQKIVIEKLSREGIIIEVNPTSNNIIGFGDTLLEHHAYQINSITFDPNKLSICVNSDDPSVFNTNVSNELAYMYYGMVEKGVCKDEAITWLDKLRVSGLRASFIRRKDSDQEILRGLRQLLDIN